MIKTIFVLVVIVTNSYHGGATTTDFTTLQQCETAKAQIAKETKGKFVSLSMTCIEKQAPLKKTKCKIVNENYHVPHPGAHSGSGAMENFPYPVALECVEE